MYMEERVNSLPNDKILALTKLNAFADYNFSVAQKVPFVFDKVENICEENALEPMVSKRQIFRLVQIESMCRQQNKCN